MYFNVHVHVDHNLVDEFTADCLVIWITIIQKTDSKPKNRRLNIHKEHYLLHAVVKYSQISMWKIEKNTCKSKQNKTSLDIAMYLGLVTMRWEDFVNGTLEYVWLVERMIATEINICLIIFRSRILHFTHTTQLLFINK